GGPPSTVIGGDHAGHPSLGWIVVSSFHPASKTGPGPRRGRRSAPRGPKVPNAGPEGPTRPARRRPSLVMRLRTSGALQSCVPPEHPLFLRNAGTPSQAEAPHSKAATCRELRGRREGPPTPPPCRARRPVRRRTVRR